MSSARHMDFLMCYGLEKSVLTTSAGLIFAGRFLYLLIGTCRTFDCFWF